MFEFEQGGLLSSKDRHPKELAQLVAELTKAGQEHVVMHFPELSESARAYLV